MKPFSRHMPPYRHPELGFAWRLTQYAILSGFVGSIIYCLWVAPIGTLSLVGVSVAFAGMIVLASRRDERRLHATESERGAASICEFAKSFDRRMVDPWVIRAVYEEVQAWFGGSENPFPVLPEDHFQETYRMDPDDLDLDIVEQIAQRTGRSLDGIDDNPNCGKVNTVADLVHFFNNQPLST